MGKNSIAFARLKLKNPFIAASGCFGYGWEFPQIAEKFGAISSKTVTLNPREGNVPPRIFEKAGGIVNRVGLQNCGLEVFAKEHLPKIRKIKTRVFISVFGENFKEWEEIISLLNGEDVDAFELNFSCPNLNKEVLTKNPKKCARIAEKLRKLTKKPLVAKINAVDNPEKISQILEKSGVDGIICSNTIPTEVSINGKTYKGGLSGEPIKKFVLEAIKKIRKKTKIDIAACGGIRKPKDVEDYKKVGANVFVLGSVLLVYPDIIKDFLHSLRR